MITNAAVHDALKYRIEVDRAGTRKYFNAAGQLHRDEGPAVIMTDGTKEWYHNGLRHRENGPASVMPNGRKEWWQNGKRHREDGPAYERLGLKVWYLHGELYSECAYYSQLATLRREI